MKKLAELFTNKKHTYSFELFPPKTEQGFRNLLTTIGQLADLKPDFISVTCGAFGGNREKTTEIVDYIQKKHRLTGVQHFTCIGNTKEEVKRMLDDTKRRGISNVLALRGDPPKDNPNWKPTAEHFSYSYQLCEFIRTAYGQFFSIGVAGFPEGHILCPDRNQDAQYLKMKVKAGADYVITQLFFDNKDYFEYVARLRSLGVSARIIPGIIFITDYNNIVKFCQMCGAKVTKEIHEIFAPVQNDPGKTLKEGIKFAVRQCKALLDGGAPGFHFYTLNKTHPVDAVLSEIRKYAKD